MSLPHQCDVAVVGSGPAGCLAAGLLADKGYEVVMLERERFPRPHVGESLIPHFWKYTDLLGASEAIEREGFVRKGGGIMIWKGRIRSMRFTDFGHQRPALHVERDRFDKILQEQAVSKGVQLISPALVTEAEFAGQGAEQQLHFRLRGEKQASTIRCRYVIDASGQKTFLGQQLDLREIDPQFRFFSIWGYFRDSRYVAIDGSTHPHEEVLSLPPTTIVTSLPNMADWGWSWHLPLRDSTSVGLVVPMSEMDRFKLTGLNWAQWFEQTCRATPVLSKLLADASLIPDSVGTIRDYSYRTTRPSGPGYFLAGDAAGFVDPIFSVGIVASFYSAYSSAWAVDRCLKKPEQASRYQDIYNDQLSRRVETARTLALPSYQPIESLHRTVTEGIGFESLNEQALMNVAATMASRSGNCGALGFQTAAVEQAMDKISELDRIIC